MLFVICVPAIETCYGLYHMGFSAHWKKYCWNWAELAVRDAEEISGVVFLQTSFIC